MVLICLLSFYVTYLSYRNLKSFLPFVNGANHDQALLDAERWFFFGNDPATILHDLLGTGAIAHVLSFVYLAFLTFVPLSIGFALIWSSRLRVGIWYVTTLSICWLLGALSYYLVPALGPAYAEPKLFNALPETGVARLQDTLFEHRGEVLFDPQGTSAVQSIAAFASLHVAVLFAAAAARPARGRPARAADRPVELPRRHLDRHHLLRLALRGRRRRRAAHRRHRGVRRRADVRGRAARAVAASRRALSERERDMSRSSDVNLPNCLTVARMCLTPALVILLIGDAWGPALAVFIVAMATDALDGYLARSRGLVTDFGRLMDPIADKLLTGAAFVCLAAIDRIDPWAVALILTREAAVSGIRLAARRQGMVISANRLGKAKTVVQTIAIVVLIVASDPGRRLGPGARRPDRRDHDRLRPGLRDQLLRRPQGTRGAAVTGGLAGVQP